MYIENFDTWFESKKVITGKSEEMNNLKDIFFDCYENFFFDCYENFFFNLKNDELEDRISELEDAFYNLKGDNEELADERDKFSDDLEQIIVFIKKSESLDELKGKMKEYGYM